MLKNLDCKPKGCKPKPRNCKPKDCKPPKERIVDFLHSRTKLILACCVLFIIIGGGILATRAYTWQEPNSAWLPTSTTPPQGNVNNPVNTGPSDQTKTGGLTIGSITQSPGRTTYLWAANSNQNQALMFAGWGVAHGGIYWKGATSTFTLDTGNDADSSHVYGNANLNVTGDVKGTRLCIGTDCRDTWPSGTVATYNNLPAGAIAGDCHAAYKWASSNCYLTLDEHTAIAPGSLLATVYGQYGVTTYECGCAAGWAIRYVNNSGVPHGCGTTYGADPGRYIDAYCIKQ